VIVTAVVVTELGDVEDPPPQAIAVTSPSQATAIHSRACMTTFLGWYQQRAFHRNWPEGTDPRRVTVTQERRRRTN
jgi:hypothetical protein